jgi:molecular chaperone GrpE
MAGPGQERDPEDRNPEERDSGWPTVRDKRRIDPETGEVRGSANGDAAAADAKASAAAAAYGHGASAVETELRAEEAAEAATDSAAEDAALELAATTLRVQELVTDLQRLQAEYVNYRKRVDRDRDVARDLAVAGVLEALMPVLDDVHLARQHGDLESGPFAAIAEKLETTLTRYGLERYGEPGEVFDPTIHEALIHTQAELAEGTTDTTVVQILQPGYRMKDRVLRAARVAVADPE